MNVGIRRVTKDKIECQKLKKLATESKRYICFQGCTSLISFLHHETNEQNISTSKFNFTPIDLFECLIIGHDDSTIDIYECHTYTTRHIGGSEDKFLRCIHFGDINAEVEHGQILEPLRDDIEFVLRYWIEQWIEKVQFIDFDKDGKIGQFEWSE